MQITMQYSESGGVTKTATTLGLGMAAAESGKRVVIIDLDPRAAITKWLDIEPVEAGLDISAILGNEDVTGWAEELAVQTTFHPNLRAIPSDRNLSVREQDGGDTARLQASLEGLRADLVLIDCPNRQGGPLILNALQASDSVIYAAAPSADGFDGFLGAQQSVLRYNTDAGTARVEELGIIIAGVKETVMSRETKHSIDQLRETGLLLSPIVPNRSIVGEVRYNHDWYGRYRKGQPIVAAYQELARKVIR